MCLPDPRSPGAEANHPEVICWPSKCAFLGRRIAWRVSNSHSHADRGADAATARYQVANPRRHVSLRVALRLTAMDVCCGPPAECLALPS
jgi:hypothetical protein